jgi:hypothetical protein
LTGVVNNPADTTWQWGDFVITIKNRSVIVKIERAPPAATR